MPRYSIVVINCGYIVIYSHIVERVTSSGPRVIKGLITGVHFARTVMTVALNSSCPTTTSCPPHSGSDSQMG
jgi:hypothetical protein